jgi:YbbR domain-containing protein
MNLEEVKTTEIKENEPKSKSNFSWNKLFKSNKFIFVISLIISVVIWITVSPDRTITISVPLNVSTEGTAVGQLGLEVVEGQGQLVDVEVKGKWYVISNLTESSIRLSVPFTNITKSGEQELKVSASLASSVNSDVTIVKVVPDTVKLTFDTVQELPFTITPKVNGVTAADGLVAGLPVVSNEEVYIKAAKTVLDSIDSVVAEVDVNKTLSKSESYTVKLKVLDGDGNEIDSSKLSMDVDEVTITQPINKTKQLSVNATFKNQPEYYKSYPLSATVSPSTINVVGDVDVVDAIDSVTLDAIDFSDLTPTNYQFTYSVSLPNGVTAVDDVQTVAVSVDVSGISTTALDVTKFVAVNAPNGKTVTATISSKSVTVAGPESVIEALQASDVYLEYDLSETSESAGERVVNATLKSSTYNNVWGVGNIQIQVKIS